MSSGFTLSIPSWLDQGKTVAKAKKLKVDAVTGATLTSNALMKNMQKGLEYYEKNK